MLDKKDAIRIDKVEYGLPRKSGTRRTQKVYIFNCKECAKEIRSQIQYLSKHTGKCVCCAQFNDPFRAAYNELLRSCQRRKHNITLTYEEFYEFTKIKNCHYCLDVINWFPHTKNNGKDVNGSRSYKLDRTDNNLGYTKQNCVVCCWKCNQGKGDRYTYEEWFAMTRYFRNLKQAKELNQ